jgi:hypothetical protein
MRTRHSVACTLPIFSTKGHESSAHVMSGTKILRYSFVLYNMTYKMTINSCKVTCFIYYCTVWNVLLCSTPFL